MKPGLHTWKLAVWASGAGAAMLAGLAGCGAPAKNGAAEGGAEVRASTSVVASGDAGLEVVWFGSTIEQGALASALAGYADQPVPMARDVEALWNEHGLRVISVPVDDVGGLVDRMQASGSGGGMSQKQWLGQAYRWTEVARGAEIAREQTVALDAERIKLGAGALRLLARSWVEPAPPSVVVGAVTGKKEAGEEGASAVLRVELVPQHLEMGRRTLEAEAFALEQPKIEAESQGLLFTRLYAKMAMPAGRALVIVAERPGVVWREVASKAKEEEDARAREMEEQKQARVEERGAENPWPEPKDRARRANATTDEWGKVRIKTDEPEDGETKAVVTEPTPGSGAPRVGQVVRGERGRIAPAREPVEVAGPRGSGPAASGPDTVRVPTLGEAMMTRSGRMIDDKRREPTMRSVVILVPKVPKEFRLIGN